MGNFVEKLDSYEIMINLLPGAFFGMALRFLCGLELPVANIGEEIVVYYFMGFIINRLGSLIIKPLLLKCNFIREVDYNEYVKAEKINEKVRTLAEICNYYRSILTASLILLIIKVFSNFKGNAGCLLTNWKFCFLLGCITLFLFSYKKQMKFVCRRVEVLNEVKGEPDKK
ncbi:hypothetical protein [Hungatella hathewayi]|uniref:hypothetical protein n=1 Tax=Hungatella hathewayi TaxID=154046 RepID=UPI00033BC387|nr:hypothetical protein [Hungatella hathewayi]CCZ60026.1 putative uncharacterized protein [Hungatella hathewayi CAG:224]